jgi:hypothetical protein
MGVQRELFDGTTKGRIHSGQTVMRRAAGAVLAATCLCLSAPGAADALAPLADATTPGRLTSYSTLISAGFEWRIDGDDNGNCVVTLEYRKTGESAWRPAQPLLRVEHGIWTHGEDPGNLLAGSLFFLAPATAYEARLTLDDPDGGAAQQVVSFATRDAPPASTQRTLHVVPGAGGGTGTPADPFRGLAAADAAAEPGDLFILAPGTYAGPFVVTRDGDAARPITYRGADPAQVTIDGGGGTSGGSHCVVLRGRRHVAIEHMRIVNALRPVNADSTTGIAVRGCHIQPVDVLNGAQGIRAAFSRDLWIANNTMVMPGRWETIGRTGAYGIGGYAILIEGTGHVVCFNAVIEAWDAIATPVTEGGVPPWTTSNVDVYGNFVDRASDDGVQTDATHHNIRVFRNRLLNTGSAMSFQPSFGGPGYMLFNEVYNTRIEPYKFHQETYYGWTQETSGFVVHHNTTVCSRQAWYETGEWRHGAFRNNLMLGGRANTYTLRLGYDYPGADFDHNGYNRVAGFPDLVWFSGAAYTDPPAWYAATGNEKNGTELGVDAFADLTLPHHPEWNYPDGYGAPYQPDDNDLRLAAGSAAVDRGQPLANINDGFTGGGPDLGCYESGTALPRYGPRPVGAALGAIASVDVASGNAPLSVSFRGVAVHASGIATAYHWDFGDRSGAADEENPSHTYALPGAYPVKLTVIDADGEVATADLTILVTGSTTGVDSSAASFALGPAVPNPFETSTAIRFGVAERSWVILRVFDVNGGLVRELANGVLPAGPHAVSWDGRGADGRRRPPGIYLVQLRAGGLARTGRVVLLE